MRDPIAPGPLIHPTGEAVADVLLNLVVVILGLASVGTVGGYLPWALRRARLWRR